MEMYNTINEENSTAPPNTSSASVPPAKRKRGRPRKDGSMVSKEGEGSLHQSPTNSVSDGITRPISQHQNDNIGRIVSGVIDGCFDAGYFLSVRIGNSNGPPLRGVIFDPQRITPVSSENDVAPNVTLFHKSEVPVSVPVPNPQCQGNGISASQLDMEISQVFPSNSRSSLVEQIVMQETPTFGYLSQPVPPPQNLRMVEQDEMMQVYEVSVQSEGLMEDAISSKEWNVSSSEVKQSDFKDPFNGLVPDQDHQHLARDSLVIETSLEPGQMVPQQIIELHDTPIADHAPPANQSFDSELQKTSTVDKMNPKMEQNKQAQYDLERQNFGVLRDLVSGNHHNFLPPESISDQPDQKFMMEKPDSPKCGQESVTGLESKTLGNDLQTPQKIPFDLELAAEESSRPESKVPSPTKNPGSISGSDPR